MSEQYDIDIPPHWEVLRYKKTGGKLIAKFRCFRTGWVLNIVPYKSYGLYEFTSCHRITLTKEESVEVIVEGIEAEHPDDAEKIAVETMKST